jgi:hypothetical protein
MHPRARKLGDEAACTTATLQLALGFRAARAFLGAIPYKGVVNDPVIEFRRRAIVGSQEPTRASIRLRHAARRARQLRDNGLGLADDALDELPAGGHVVDLDPLRRRPKTAGKVRDVPILL